jgi:hypothetical protein
MNCKQVAISLAITVPLWVHALDLREPPVQAVRLDPSGGGSEASQTLRLREALRQSPPESLQDSQRYRLTAEARRRLREQLRDHSAGKVGSEP